MKERKPLKRPEPGAEASTPWGWRRAIALTEAYDVYLETMVAGANTGVQTARQLPHTVVVLTGVLWIRDVASGQVARIGAGQSVTVAVGRAVELATGKVDADLLVIRPPSFDEQLDRKPGTGVRPYPRIGQRTTGVLRRPPQRPLEQRGALANAAQGLTRMQILPGQPRTAADVSLGFNVHGVNLAPVVPEP